MEKSARSHTRRLPHLVVEKGTYFITFRLVDSLPSVALVKLKNEYDEALSALEHLDSKPTKHASAKHTLRHKYIAKVDSYLDQAVIGPRWLADPIIAEIVSEALHFRNGREYDLLAFTIMPNHVHMLISMEIDVNTGPSSYYLTRRIGLLKSFTAKKINATLGRSGQIWQHESYDHIVHDDREVSSVVEYILNNPVKAGLVNEWGLWPWSYSKFHKPL